jgi:YidC/Oxa1 family membrane protein insertase
MDRRTLLAFVLLTIILMLFSRVTSPPKRPAPAPATPTTASPAPAQERSSETGLSSSQEGGKVGGQIGEGNTGRAFRNVLPHTSDGVFPVETKLFRTEVSPHGGRIGRWILSGYTDAREQPADLVAQPGLGMLNLRVDRPEGGLDLGEIDFQATATEEEGAKAVRLEAQDSSGATVRIDYEFPEGRTSAELKVALQGFASERGEAFLELSFPAGISFLERDQRVDHNGAAGIALLGKNQYVRHSLGRGSGGWTEREAGVVRWAGTRSKYFLLAFVPHEPCDGEIVLSRDQGANAIVSRLRVPLERGGPTEYRFTLYAGPMQYQSLQSVGVDLERALDLGWAVLVPFSRLLLRFFRAVHSVVPNYGIVILILSVLTKVLFYPLSKKSVESMKQMQLLKPEIDRISEKFKDDPQRRNQATMDLYKKNKVNPVGGCLPILIQMPVFIALYSVLNSAIELRKAPFALWIQDLSSPDKVGAIAGFPIHILPLVMAGTMFWQQKLTPTDPRQAAMAYLMPAVMTIFFYPMPSGLVFYWTVNNLMSIGQQIWMNRTMKHSQLATLS